MNEETKNRQIQDALLSYLGLTQSDVQDWAEHATAVAKADDGQELTYAEHVNAIEDSAVDLTNTSVGDKVGLLVDDTLNRLLANEIELENAQELIALIQAVDMAIDVAAKGKNLYV